MRDFLRSSSPAQRTSARLAREFRRAANALDGVAARRDVRQAPHDPRGAFEFARSYSHGSVSIQPAQVEAEILELMELLAERRPRRIVEIGTFKGGTLFLFATVAASDAKFVSVDMRGGPFGGGYRRGHSGLLRSFARGDQEILLIGGDSHAPSTVERVRTAIGGSADFLFVDGDHTLEGVKADFRNYGPLVRAGGLIAFHDIVPGPPDAVGGVPEFWSEVKGDFQHREIVADWGQGGYGLGVLEISTPIPV